MPDDKSRNEPWRKQVPDYMVAAIDSICDARDDIRSMQAELSKSKQELGYKEQIIGDREQALLSAIDDMKEFASRLYGPDSELTKINQKLSGIESSLAARNTQYDRQFQEIHDNQTRLIQRCDQVEMRVSKLEERLDFLEKSA